jgi:hypothetical protein
MPTVFILQESKSQDFSDVKRFGTPEVIVVGNVTNPTGAAHRVFETLRVKFKPNDRIVPNGSPLGLMAAGAALAYLNRDIDMRATALIDVLIWNRSKLCYDLIQWPLPR